MTITTRHVPTPESRDRAAALLRRLTVWLAVGATGAVGFFAVIAAATIPGRTTDAAQSQPPSTSTGSGSSATTQAGDDTSSSGSATTSASSGNANVTQPSVSSTTHTVTGSTR